MIPGTGQDRQAQLFRGTLDMCMLALLADKPAHGYELVRRLEAAGFPGVGYGTVYPLLTRMHRQHLVSSAPTVSPTGPPRKVYNVTTQGARRLEEWTRQWGQFVHIVNSVLERQEGEHV